MCAPAQAVPRDLIARVDVVAGAHALGQLRVQTVEHGNEQLQFPLGGACGAHRFQVFLAHGGWRAWLALHVAAPSHRLAGLNPAGEELSRYWVHAERPEVPVGLARIKSPREIELDRFIDGNKASFLPCIFLRVW